MKSEVSDSEWRLDSQVAAPPTAAALMADSGDIADFNAVFSGVGLTSLLSSRPAVNSSPSESTDSTAGGSRMSFLEALGLVPEGFLALGHKQLADGFPYGGGEVQKLTPLDADGGGGGDDLSFGFPKVSPTVDLSKPYQYQPLNETSIRGLAAEGLDMPATDLDSSFHRLPDLQCLEQEPMKMMTSGRFGCSFSVAVAGDSSPANKRGRSSDLNLNAPSPIQSPGTDSYTLDAIVRSFKVGNGGSSGPYKASRTATGAGRATLPQAQRQSSLAKESQRRQRQRVSEKIKCLERLLPSEKKMDMATLLEETYKYIRFLQVQLAVLRSMPCSAEASSSSSSCNVGGGGGGALGRLNRQQLLEVVVNSPEAQRKMYSQGLCIFSGEQLALLKEAAERRAFLRQMLFVPSNLC